ncbi:glycosyltransferase [Coprococcus catus]
MQKKYAYVTDYARLWIIYNYGGVYLDTDVELYFCPLEPTGVNIRKTKHTYSIHWFSASWLSDEEMIIHEWRIFSGKCEKYLGRKMGHIIARFIYLFQPQKRKVLKKNSQ